MLVRENLYSFLQFLDEKRLLRLKDAITLEEARQLIDEFEDSGLRIWERHAPCKQQDSAGRPNLKKEV